MRGGGTCPPFKRDIQLQRGEVLKEAPKPSSRTMTGTFQDGGRRGSGHHRKIVSDESLALPQLPEESHYKERTRIEPLSQKVQSILKQN